MVWSREEEKEEKRLGREMHLYGGKGARARGGGGGQGRPGWKWSANDMKSLGLASEDVLDRLAWRRRIGGDTCMFD